MEKGIATHSRILSGRNACSLPLLPAGILIWGCEDFSEFSGDEISREDAPQSRAHCGLSQYPQFWARWEPSLTNSAGRVQAPGWFQDTSLFPLPSPSFLMSGCQWSFWNSHRLPSKDTRTSPGGSQVNCPHPSSETLLIHNSWHYALNIVQRVPCRWRSRTLL